MKVELFVMILEKLILFGQHVARAVAIRVLETNARFFKRYSGQVHTSADWRRWQKHVLAQSLSRPGTRSR